MIYQYSQPHCALSVENFKELVCATGETFYRDLIEGSNWYIETLGGIKRPEYLEWFFQSVAPLWLTASFDASHYQQKIVRLIFCAIIYCDNHLLQISLDCLQRELNEEHLKMLLLTHHVNDNLLHVAIDCDHLDDVKALLGTKERARIYLNRDDDRTFYYPQNRITRPVRGREGEIRVSAEQVAACLGRDDIADYIAECRSNTCIVS